MLASLWHEKVIHNLLVYMEHEVSILAFRLEVCGDTWKRQGTTLNPQNLNPNRTRKQGQPEGGEREQLQYTQRLPGHLC